MSSSNRSTSLSDHKPEGLYVSPLYGQRSDLRCTRVPATRRAQRRLQALQSPHVHQVCRSHGSPFNLCGLRGPGPRQPFREAPAPPGLVNGERPGQRTNPVVTYAIIGVCVALWVGDILTKGVITNTWDSHRFMACISRGGS